MTLSQIHRRMKGLGRRSRAAGLQRFFKTAPGEYGAGDRFLGIRVPAIRQVARECRELSLRDLASLLKSPWHEERLLALVVLVKQYGDADERKRTAIYRFYLKHSRHINNWDLVDCSAPYIVGPYLRHRSRRPLRQLARSKVVWRRRIAVLATFHYIAHGECGESLAVAEALLHDSHDLIHKAIGWMLREVGKHAHHMPRTMLRYAIERLPRKRRLSYLNADA